MAQQERHIKKAAIHTDTIQLDQLLKFEGVIETGGGIKPLLEGEKIYVNGALCTAKRKKLVPGDTVDIDGVGSWLVVREGAAE